MLVARKEKTLGKKYDSSFILETIFKVRVIYSSNGDSGGPLMKEITKRDILSHYTLVGLVSFGPKMCGTKDHPGMKFL